MPLRKPVKTGGALKPKDVKFASSSFNYDSVYQNRDLTDLFASNFSGVIMLYNDYYKVNTDVSLPGGKYVVGLVREDDEWFVPPKLGCERPMRISGTWIFENLYIDGQGFILNNGAKLVFRNCYLSTYTDVSFDYIQAQNGYIRFYDTTLLMQAVGGAIIRCVVGSDVKVINSSLNGVAIEKATGTMIIKNSSVQFERNYTTLNNYNIVAENSFLERSLPPQYYLYGTIKVDAQNCVLSTPTTYFAGHFGDSVFRNCRFSRIWIRNTNATLRFVNCYFQFDSSGGSERPVYIDGGTPYLEFFNSVFRTQSYYVAQFYNSSAIAKFINCTFKSAVGRFQKGGSGTNSILTVGCVGNKDVTTDSGFNAGEVSDTSFIYDGNF
jgi:hypothetical protein